MAWMFVSYVRVGLSVLLMFVCAYLFTNYMCLVVIVRDDDDDDDTFWGQKLTV